MKKDDKQPESVTPDASKETLAPSRRNLLRALTVSGVAVAGKQVSGDWVKPVTELVALPAHAQTTAGARFGSRSGLELPLQVRREQPYNPAVPGILDSVAPIAHAGLPPPKKRRNQVSAFVSASNECWIRFTYGEGGPCKFWEEEFGFPPGGGGGFGLLFIICYRGSIHDQGFSDIDITSDTCEIFGFPESVSVKYFPNESPPYVRVEFNGVKFNIDLEPGGSPPDCPDCDDQAFPRYEEECLDN